MKIKLELFGVCREFSEQDYLDFNFESDIKIKDLRKEVEGFVNKNCIYYGLCFLNCEYLTFFDM